MDEKYSKSENSKIDEETSLLSRNDKNVTQIIGIGKITTKDVLETPNIALSSKDGNEFLIISAQEYQRFIKETKSYKVVTTLDVLFAMFIVTPAVVGFWRGSWVLMDKFRDYFPPWGVCAFSTIVQVGFTIYRRNFISFSRRCRSSKYCSSFATFAMIFYNYAFANLAIMSWRALWQIIDRYTNVVSTRDGRVLPDHSRTVLMVSLVCLLLVAAMKCVRNTSAVPFGIARDTVKCTYDFPTRYKIEMDEKTSLYILDCLFSVIIVGTLVVFVWRGGWVLLDIFIFPENEVYSAWGSLVIGYAVVAIAFLIQPAMRMLCDRIKGALRLLVADIFLIFSLVGTINVWRGIWNLLNLYLLPDNIILSCWLTHWSSWIILVLLGCSNSLLVRGVYIDAEEPAGKCVVFPCYYLRIIFQEERLKKLNTMQLEASSKSCKDNSKRSGDVLENNHIVNISTISDQVQSEINHKTSV